MRIFAERVLADDRVAKLRTIFTGDWLVALASSENTEAMLMLMITTVDGENLSMPELKALPLEDYFVILHALRLEFDRIRNYAPL